MARDAQRARVRQDATRQEHQRVLTDQAASIPEVAAAMEAMARLARYSPVITSEVRTIRYATGGNG